MNAIEALCESTLREWDEYGCPDHVRCAFCGDEEAVGTIGRAPVCDLHAGAEYWDGTRFRVEFVA